MHVDDFIDEMNQENLYARWFFFLHRLPAFTQANFAEYIEQYKLFCIYKEEKYRVTGASRLGDVWLTKNFEQSCGYELRVDLADCSQWTEK